jgi:hypothetical protein
MAAKDERPLMTRKDVRDARFGGETGEGKEI